MAISHVVPFSHAGTQNTLTDLCNFQLTDALAEVFVVCINVLLFRFIDLPFATEN